MPLAVQRTREFTRICELPRRKLSLDVAQAWAEYLTPRLALRPDAKLRPWQAMALVEALECGGAWLALPVGQGKTLISALLPVVLASKRTLLVVPGSLVQKTYSDFLSYVGVWRQAINPIRVETREKLSVASGAQLLADFAPDLVIIDEADDLANPRSACARRIDRYVRDHSPRVVALTGTPSRKSLLNYWHIVAWTLGDGAPLPLRHEEAMLWAGALDDHRGMPVHPGPLGASQRAARAWYRQRLVETPGVVVVDEDSCDAPLTVRIRLANEDPILDAAFERFGVEQENPGGIPVSDPLSRWLLDGQLGLGLYSRWNPPPPESWREARRNIARFVRERIEASTRSNDPLDTEAQVIRRFGQHPIVQKWLEEKPTFDGVTETVWISRSALDSCRAWLAELDRPGIVWCGNVAFGRALAQEAGLCYYGQRGETDHGSQLHTAPKDQSLIASWNANKKGFNLQAWSRQLIAMPPQSAKWLEQIFGRSHRSGQTDHVIVDVLATSGGTIDAFEAAIAEAQLVRDTLTLEQKVLRADIIRAHPEITHANKYRWARRETGE